MSCFYVLFKRSDQQWVKPGEKKITGGMNWQGSNVRAPSTMPMVSCSNAHRVIEHINHHPPLLLDEPDDGTDGQQGSSHGRNATPNALPTAAHGRANRTNVWRDACQPRLQPTRHGCLLSGANAATSATKQQRARPVWRTVVSSGMQLLFCITSFVYLPQFPRYILFCFRPRQLKPA